MSATFLPPAAQERQGERAGVVSRTLAAAVDFVIVTVMQAALYGAIVFFLFILSPRHFSWPTELGWSLPAVGFGIAVPYLSLCWITTGRTYGCALFGLRVINREGTRLRFPIALLRAIAYVLFPIGLFWTAISPANRSIQDIVLRSSVIYDWTSHRRSAD